MQKGLINKSGAYALKINGIVRYVGSGLNLESRKSNHLARFRQGTHNKELQKLFDEFGEESFEFVVLEYCNKSNVYKLEEKYMEKYKDTIVNKNRVRNKHKKLRRGLNSVEHKEKFSKLMQGTRNPNNKYDIDTIIEIKQMLEMGLSNTEISKKTNINRNYISQIRNGQKWSCVNILPI